MAKQELTIKLTLEYDTEQNDNKPAHIFLYQFITRLNRRWRILEVVYKGIKKDYRENGDINKIALKKVNSITDKDLPQKPSYLKNKTVIPPRNKIIKQ